MPSRTRRLVFGSCSQSSLQSTYQHHMHRHSLHIRISMSSFPHHRSRVDERCYSSQDSSNKVWTTCCPIGVHQLHALTQTPWQDTPLAMPRLTWHMPVQDPFQDDTCNRIHTKAWREQVLRLERLYSKNISHRPEQPEDRSLQKNNPDKIPRHLSRNP